MPERLTVVVSGAVSMCVMPRSVPIRVARMDPDESVDPPEAAARRHRDHADRADIRDAVVLTTGLSGEIVRE